MPLAPAPQILLKAPRHDPPGTFRARNISDMWRMLPDILVTTFDNISYELGKVYGAEPIKYAIQNRTVNVDISVNISLPEYLQSDLIFPVIVPRNSIVNFTIGVKETAIKQYVPGQFDGTIQISVSPQGISGPVHVLIDPPVLHDPNIIIPETPIEIFVPEILPTVEEVIPILEPVSVEVIKQMWRNGETGALVEGRPPEGWVVEADGAIYPPLPPIPLPEPIPTWINEITNKIEEGYPPAGWVSLGANTYGPPQTEDEENGSIIDDDSDTIPAVAETAAKKKKKSTLKKITDAVITGGTIATAIGGLGSLPLVGKIVKSVGGKVLGAAAKVGKKLIKGFKRLFG